MSPSFAANLDLLRGFGPGWEEGAEVPLTVSPLERLVQDAEPLGAELEKTLLQMLVFREAALFAEVLHLEEGAREWARWVEGEVARARKQPPPVDITPVRELSCPDPARLADALNDAGFRRIHRALFLRHVRRSNPSLSSRFETRFKQLEVARRPLLLHNLKLALWSTRIPAFSSCEALLYGTIGIADAIDRFELDRGRVSTYAGSWIRARKSRASANWVGALRDPGYLAEQRMKLRTAAADIREAGGEPTVSDLVGVVEGIEPRRVAEVYRGRHLGGRLASKGAGGAQLLLDLSTEDPLHDWVRFEQLKATWMLVQAALEKLPERQRHIASARLGLADGRRPTLSELGETHGLSRERIRQLERMAFQAVRKHAISVLRSEERQENDA